MDGQDLNEIKKICAEYIQKGHQYKAMGESEIYKEMFGIQNPKEFALGLILGAFLQTCHRYWKDKYDTEMDQENANLVLGIFNEFAPSIIDSLFK